MTRGRSDVSRLLALVPYLRSHPGVAVTEAARVFDVPPSRIVADLRILWMCGLPGGLPDDLIDIDMDAVDAEGTITLTNADALPRPMKLTPDEAWSLLAALQVVADLADPTTAGAVASAQEKLRGLAPVGEGVIEASASVTSDPRTEWFVRSCRDRRRLEIHHRRQDAAEATQQVVDPARVEVRDGRQYLVGWSTARRDWRTWRLDRIVDARQIGPAAGHGRPPEHLEWFGDVPADDEVTLLLTPRSGWVGEYHPTRAVERVPRGWRMTFAVASRRWLADLLVALGPDVLDVDPPEAAADAARLVRGACQVHGVDSVDQGASGT